MARNLAEEQAPGSGRTSPAGNNAPGKNLRHELRTPINQIIGYAELLGEEAESDGQKQYLADLEKIGNAARNLLETIDRIPLDGEPGKAPAPARVTPKVTSGEYVAPASRAADREQEQPARLLVVDDIEANRAMLARRLERRGFEVGVAEGGQEALDKIRTEDFDLILLDIMMPEVSGYDVLEEVRKTYSPLQLPVIMATAKDQGEDVVNAFKLGANDYITKPIDFKVALVRIETQLSRKKAMEEAERLTGELERHNQFLRKTFGRYLSKEIVENILSSPEGLKLGGEKRTITIMMSDLRGFSALSENLDPEQVVTMLNNYLAAMADIVTKYGGTIDEFIGDAILVLFGAPVCRDDDPDRAVACAIEMQCAMEAVNEENRHLGFPELEMGIALNTGECVVGNIGSQKRAKYGVVGSHVNLTGRIESYTVGGQVLVSKSVVDATQAELILGEEMKLGAKGFKEPVTAHELKGMKGDRELRVPERSTEIRKLVREIPLHISVLDGKHITDDCLEARLVALSMKEGEASIQGALKPLSNVLIRFTGLNGVIIPGDLYAKVISVESENARLHFTSVPDDIKSFLRSTLASEVE